MKKGKEIKEIKEKVKVAVSGPEYRFTVGTDYVRTGQRYEAGTVDDLVDWYKKDIQSALKAGTIQEV